MGLFARPYDMFMEKVDHEKYPCELPEILQLKLL